LNRISSVLDGIEGLLDGNLVGSQLVDGFLVVLTQLLDISLQLSLQLVDGFLVVLTHLIDVPPHLFDGLVQLFDGI
jgi:hypothetical protein